MLWNICVCIHVCMCIHACICTCICVFIYVWMYVCECILIRVYPILYFIYLLCSFLDFEFSTMDGELFILVCIWHIRELLIPLQRVYWMNNIDVRGFSTAWRLPYYKWKPTVASYQTLTDHGCCFFSGFSLKSRVIQSHFRYKLASAGLSNTKNINKGETVW